MAKAAVHFLPVRDGEPAESLAEKALRLCNEIFENVVVRDRPCAIKQHFGEGKNTNFVKPEVARAVAGFVKERGGCPFVTDMAKNCDCMAGKQPIEYPNIGILARTDIVAVDKTSADLAIERYGKDVWRDWWPESDYAAQFSYGEELGIGSRAYEIVEVS